MAAVMKNMGHRERLRCIISIPNSMSSAPLWITERQAKPLKCGRSETRLRHLLRHTQKPQLRQVIDNSGNCGSEESPSRTIGRQSAAIFGFLTLNQDAGFLGKMQGF